MNPLNYLYVTILAVVLAGWFYHLATQQFYPLKRPQKVIVFLGLFVAGFVISGPFVQWLATPGLQLMHWWSQIIPSDQLPSRIFFWVFTLAIMVVFMCGICFSEGWTDFVDGVDQDSFGVVVFCFAFFLAVGAFLGYLFCLTLFSSLMRLA